MTARKQASHHRSFLYAVCCSLAASQFGRSASSNVTERNQSPTNAPASNTEVPEITINADLDKVRAVIVRRLIRDKFNLDKDQPSQLVFSKEVGGASGFLAGVFMGRDQNNPRQIVTFVLTKTETGVLALAIWKPHQEVD